MELKMRAKIIKRGNSYCFPVPKGFLDTKVLKEGEEYELDIGAKVYLDNTQQTLSVPELA